MTMCVECKCDSTTCMLALLSGRSHRQFTQYNECGALLSNWQLQLPVDIPVAPFGSWINLQRISFCTYLDDIIMSSNYVLKIACVYK